MVINRIAAIKHIKRWAFATAAEHFILFLLLFLIISYLSTLLTISESPDSETVFISKYEKYIVLSTSLYMVIPFAASTILLVGLFHEKVEILNIYAIFSYVNCGVIFIIMFGSGIFLAIKGTNYVAYSLIAFGIFIELILSQGILITLAIQRLLLNSGDFTNGTIEDTTSINSSVGSNSITEV